jgi:molybdopterin converting factor small subunit
MSGASDEKRPDAQPGKPTPGAVTVCLPAALTSPEPPLELPCAAGTVEDALHAVVAQAPRYAQRIFYKQRPLVTIVLNGRHLAPSVALATETSDGDRLQLMPPVAGG